MSELLVHSGGAPGPDGTILAVTPESAGLRYVGFEMLSMADGVVARRDTGDRELCAVVISGTATVSSEHGRWSDLGGRADPWAGMPDAAYLPPRTSVTIEGEAEVALCWAPAPRGGSAARVLLGDQIEVETRGHGVTERKIRPILMADKEADSLLVVEVITPAGHWSSYPPHKHDRDAAPEETLLEETYYHRLDPPQGFVFQRVYTDDRSLDESHAVEDGDVMLVPRGYHPVVVPWGYRSYYLNVMAGPSRAWHFKNDPAHEWMLAPQP
jgi:5-deoxy-glucuronate isomerase